MSVWQSVDGYKTYIGLGIGAAIVIVHKLGVDIPGVAIDDAAVAQNLWTLFLAATARHALGKTEPPK
jgi:hypothetical protein